MIYHPQVLTPIVYNPSALIYCRVFCLTFKTPFCTSTTSTIKFFVAFYLYTVEKQYLPLVYTMYAVEPDILCPWAQNVWLWYATLILK